MMVDSELLGRFWLAIVIHLWQTTLVLVPLFLVARSMRNAPARIVNGIWTVGLLKVFVPVAVVVPMARRVLLPLLRRVLPSAFGGAGTPVWLERVHIAVDPTVLAVSGQVDGLEFAPALLGLATVVWVGGMIWLGVRWMRVSRPRSLASSAISVREAAQGLRKPVLSAASQTGVPADIIYIAPGSAMPAVVGLLRRRIVISEAMIDELKAAELRAVLLHENEHRRRYDPLRALIQRCALAVFFFYPLLWVVLRRLTSSCEIACDEAAVEGGIAPRAYARALARTVSIGLLPSYSATGIAGRTSSLLHQRLSRLSTNRRYVTMLRHRLALGAAVLVVLTVSLIPLPPVAGTEEDGQTLETPPSPPKTAVIDSKVGPPPEAAQGPDEEALQPPRLVPGSHKLPEYPEPARKNGIEGEVLLDVTVKTDGSVGAVTLKQGVPECPALDESAQAAVRKWKFEPATENGKPVEMTVAIPVRFRLEDEDKPIQADTMPELLSESVIKPVYPEDARKAGISGKVVLDVVVMKDGTPGEIAVREGIEGYPSLAESAMEAVSQWRFKPATRKGEPVDMAVAIPVAFRLDDCEESKAQTD